MSVERRGGDILAGQEPPHRTPPTPAPLEDRFFTDWSSLGSRSPHVRMPPQCSSKRNINEPANQTTQPGSEPTQIGVMENPLQEDTIVSPPRTQ